jgi:hypothetical protein
VSSVQVLRNGITGMWPRIRYGNAAFRLRQASVEDANRLEDSDKSWIEQAGGVSVQNNAHSAGAPAVSSQNDIDQVQAMIDSLSEKTPRELADGFVRDVQFPGPGGIETSTRARTTLMAVMGTTSIQLADEGPHLSQNVAFVGQEHVVICVGYLNHSCGRHSLLKCNRHVSYAFGLQRLGCCVLGSCVEGVRRRLRVGKNRQYRQGNR